MSPDYPFDEVLGLMFVIELQLEQRLAIHSTPRMLCCIGDIKEDHQYYEEAW